MRDRFSTKTESMKSGTAFLPITSASIRSLAMPGCVMPLFASVYMCLVVTCWDRADLLALVCDVLLWVCHFPIGILGQVWYLIVSIPDLCTLTYLVGTPNDKKYTSLSSKLELKGLETPETASSTYSFYFASEQIEYLISVHWRVVSIYWALMW